MFRSFPRSSPNPRNQGLPSAITAAAQEVTETAKTNIHARWQGSTNAKISLPPRGMQHDMQRSTRDEKTLSAQSATRPSPARITWSSTDVHINLDARQQKKSPIVQQVPKEPKPPPSGCNRLPFRLRFPMSPILLHR